VISETMPNGPMPLAGVIVDLTACIRDQPNSPSQSSASTQTDAAGAYRVADVCAGVAYIWVHKPGYTTGRPGVGCDGDCYKLTVGGDTRLDIDLVRQ
jgi:hypothetical protein